MIKLQNNTLTREPLPAFLFGLQDESLRDLSWTDPALGVANCAWLPEVDQSPALKQYERYGTEKLTLGDGAAIVTRAVVSWSDAEIAAEIKSKVPQSVTMRQARLALLAAGKLAAVNSAIAGMSGAAGDAARIEWEFSIEVKRQQPLVLSLGKALGMSSLQLDDLFVAAAAL